MSKCKLTWPDRWMALSGYPVTEQERDITESWLDEAFPSGWRPEELHLALENLAERARQSGKRPKSPTCPEIKSAVIRGRYTSSRGRAKRRDPACTLPHGWWKNR